VNSPQLTPQGAHLNALGCSHKKFGFLLCLAYDEAGRETRKTEPIGNAQAGICSLRNPAQAL
jgi:hypothetical protein